MAYDDPIAEWYRQQAIKKDAAYERLLQARRDGADKETLRRLEQAYEQAAYVGD